jgi:hypothetical protein
LEFIILHSLHNYKKQVDPLQRFIFG